MLKLQSPPRTPPPDSLAATTPQHSLRDSLLTALGWALVAAPLILLQSKLAVMHDGFSNLPLVPKDQDAFLQFRLPE